ncbi:hypothetical protein BGZ47_005469 [Haplosporangium gracile]|nr:hypothetical protein BGZ47_005469 [Haplosporangium gracile]
MIMTHVRSKRRHCQREAHSNRTDVVAGVEDDKEESLVWKKYQRRLSLPLRHECEQRVASKLGERKVERLPTPESKDPPPIQSIQDAKMRPKMKRNIRVIPGRFSALDSSDEEEDQRAAEIQEQDVSAVFPNKPPKKTIHIIVQSRTTVHAPVPARVLTPIPGSRPSSPLTGDLSADIKKIEDKFFSKGSNIVNFLDAFVKGQGALPTTTGHIRGLPRAWRRTFGHPTEARPSLLFLDLPDPSKPDPESRNLAAGSIFNMVRENNRALIPVFGVSGCGKTRAAVELLSQHWGFYFNASHDDWGSDDMMTLRSTVQRFLNDKKDSPVIDREANNGCARKTTLLLFLSRLLIFKYCLNASGSNDTFTSARWALLQVCPHVLYEDIFNTLFVDLLNLQHYGEVPLSLLIRNMFKDVKDLLFVRGCLPKIEERTRLLVVHDEAQVLGDEFEGYFQSSTSRDSRRPLLSPILHAFRDIGHQNFTLVTCGTGLSINTLYWVQSSGSGVKDSSTNFEHVEFPGWTNLDLINAYVSRVRSCLMDDESRKVFDERLPQDALEMLLNKFVGRYRPATVAIEKIIEHIEHSNWRALIDDTEDKLVAWEHRAIKGNLCRELIRLHQKHTDARRNSTMESAETVLDILGFYFYRRCFWGETTLKLGSVNALLVESAFGRMKIIDSDPVTVIDEPFVFKAVENYFNAMDPGLQRELKNLMDRSDAVAKGNLVERYMMTVFSETFKTRRLSDWPHQPRIKTMCPCLDGEVEIVGWREPALLQGTTHAMMSLEEFMDAHVNHQSMRNDMPVPPFFFPCHNPSGPDMVFFIRIDDCKVIPVFVQMKLHQSSAILCKKLWNTALNTVSASCIRDHAKDFGNFCPDNIYISMVVAYPMRCSRFLPPVEVPKVDEDGLQQVVIRVGDKNFGRIFPKDHVEFIDRIKNVKKRSVDGIDSDDEDRSKKQKA